MRDQDQLQDVHTVERIARALAALDTGTEWELPLETIPHYRVYARVALQARAEVSGDD